MFKGDSRIPLFYKGTYNLKKMMHFIKLYEYLILK